MLRRAGRTLVFLVIGFVIFSVVLVALFREVPPPITPLMLIRHIEGTGSTRTGGRSTGSRRI
jgi:hypothetical protein